MIAWKNADEKGQRPEGKGQSIKARGKRSKSRPGREIESLACLACPLCFPLPSLLCPLSSALFLLPSFLCPLSSALSPLPSLLCPLSSALSPLPSLLCPLSSALFPLIPRTKRPRPAGKFPAGRGLATDAAAHPGEGRAASRRGGRRGREFGVIRPPPGRVGAASRRGGKPGEGRCLGPSRARLV
jgi:hypothetical protein